MNKTTVYLPDELEARLNAEAAATGASKAELIRRGIAMVLTASRPQRRAPLPVFHSGHVRDAGQLDRELYDRIKERAGRR